LLRKNTPCLVAEDSPPRPAECFIGTLPQARLNFLSMREENMRIIKSSPHGQEILVDDSDYLFLCNYNWHINTYGYAYRFPPRNGKAKSVILMAREIMGLRVGQKKQVDHINHRRLDNRRMNLRVVLKIHNAQNQGPRCGKKYKGTTLVRSKTKTWQASIGSRGKSLYLGRFKTEEDAARAYDRMALKLWGKYASPNF
jgi:hypothetical protein